MNKTAFILALVIALGYYFYTMRKERAKINKGIGNTKSESGKV